jgi:hypothetical protein
MTEIKILIYTDSKEITLSPGTETEKRPWSVSILREILEAQMSPFLNFKLDVVNRYENPPQPRRIDDKLLEPYHQVWVFGVYQSKFDGKFSEDFGGPDNELNEGEIEALKKHMQKRGVLIAGDHSDMPPGKDKADIKEFLCLGKALGGAIPRAGELRKWVGEPTAAFTSSFNTLAVTALFNDTKDGADSDDVPQKLLLEPLNEMLPHHPIMGGKDQKDNDRPINIFPDHIHEGEVTLPGKLGDDWPPLGVPSKEKPSPVVIARGCDKRSCRSRPVLAVYDPPESLNAGRIVADSTWHHYFDINLQGLKAAGEQSAFFLLKQYYRHVAFFLAPLEIRQEVSRAILDWTLRQPEVWEEKNNEPLRVGKVALRHLSEVATRYEIFEMLQHVMLSKAKSDSEVAEIKTVDFPQLSAGHWQFPSRELVVGSIVKGHYKAAFDRLTMKDTDAVLDVADALTTASATGIKQAFEVHKTELNRVQSATKKYLKLLD